MTDENSALRGAQTLAIAVKDRVIASTTIMMWGLPIHSCHPEPQTSGLVSGLKGFISIMYNMGYVMLKGTEDMHKCMHPDHLIQA